MDLTVAFNTFYDNDRVQSGSGNAAVLNTWGNYSPTGTIRIQRNVIAAGPNTVPSSSFYRSTGNSDAYVDFRKNLYWHHGHRWPSPTKDLSAILIDPDSPQHLTATCLRPPAVPWSTSSDRRSERSALSTRSPGASPDPLR